MSRHQAASAKASTVATARMRIVRTDGSREVHYSQQQIPWWQVGLRLKAWRHLRFMKAEDKREGYGR